jgi:hypothetical protein
MLFKVDPESTTSSLFLEEFCGFITGTGMCNESGFNGFCDDGVCQFLVFEGFLKELCMPHDKDRSELDWLSTGDGECQLLVLELCKVLVTNEAGVEVLGICWAENTSTIFKVLSHTESVPAD